jgi:hypothetical protein
VIRTVSLIRVCSSFGFSLSPVQRRLLFEPCLSPVRLLLYEFLSGDTPFFLFPIFFGLTWVIPLRCGPPSYAFRAPHQRATDVLMLDLSECRRTLLLPAGCVCWSRQRAFRYPVMTCNYSVAVNRLTEVICNSEVA